jgi:predicted metal-dependent hydrolase
MSRGNGLTIVRSNSVDTSISYEAFQQANIFYAQALECLPQDAEPSLRAQTYQKCMQVHFQLTLVKSLSLSKRTAYLKKAQQFAALARESGEYSKDKVLLALINFDIAILTSRQVEFEAQLGRMKDALNDRDEVLRQVEQAWEALQHVRNSTYNHKQRLLALDWISRLKNIGADS